MENVAFRTDGRALVLILSGRIDSANAGETEKHIRTLQREHPAEKIIVDCEKLSYISSAGLRVMLRLRKATPALCLINVSAEVYDIFEMTGFTEMLDIQKAYRTISVEGCEMVGEGANGKVYRIDPETIVKTYHNPESLADINRERELARIAFVAGVPTAIAYDVVRVEGGGYGSVYELLNTRSIARLVASGAMTLEEAAQRSVELLKIIHETVIQKNDALPKMRDVALNWAAFLKNYLPPKQTEKLCTLFSAVPDDDHLLHGDYHIKNIMIHNGESLLIDMDTLCLGHPIFEFGSMYNAYVGYGEADHDVITRFIGVSFEEAGVLWRRTLELYFETADEQRLLEIERKARIIGCARMIRRSIRRNGLETERGRAEIELWRRHLTEDLEMTDTLLF
jgi:anti-anti-sigma factor